MLDAAEREMLDMEIRNSLKPKVLLKMPNQGQHVIYKKIVKGGLSLIYFVKTKANDYPAIVIIKNFTSFHLYSFLLFPYRLSFLL